MVFWAGILVGGLFIWFAVKIGFYETWATLFNIVISIYVAVFLTPVILNIIPMASDTAYGNALTMATIVIGTFLILHGITYIFFTGQFNISFPRIFDTLGAGVLGFLAGFLVWSFVALLISATPVSQNTFAKDIGFGSRIKQTNVPYISWWCDLVNSIVSSPDTKITSEQAIEQLLNNTQQKERDKTDQETGLNSPVETNGPKTSINEENKTGPP